MKIYQLHKYSGEWEDFRDIIIGSYLRRERAEEEKTKAETKEEILIEHNDRCADCPFLYASMAAIDGLIEEYPNYCNEAKLHEDEYGIDCDNYYSHWTESTFEIKEIEVEE